MCACARVPRGFKSLSRIANRASPNFHFFTIISFLSERRNDMIKLHSFLPLIFLLAVSGQLDADSNVYGASILTKVLSSVGFKAETISKILVSSTSKMRQPLDNVHDLTDDNFARILKSGEANALSQMVLPVSVVWVISVYGNDGVSPLFVNASDAVAMNSSQYGVTLSKNMRFAR